MRKFIFLPILFIFCLGFSQNKKTVEDSMMNGKINVYPTSWWVGMKNPNLQLMIRGKHIGKGIKNDFKINYPGVTLESVQKVKNPDYIFLNLIIKPATKPGNLEIGFQEGYIYNIITIPLHKIGTGNGIIYARGIQSSDFIYLLMPDRFSNGDHNN
ncbi:MAG TPA: cyclomaltodextrinase N-terminal domain-containing protein, partial [Puia sp.]